TGGWDFTQTTAGDFNGDGRTDLVAQDSRSDLWIWKGKGDGTFRGKELLSRNWASTQTTAGPFRGPGRDYLIARSDTTGDLNQWITTNPQLTNPLRLTDNW
ncbi:VCBS repeat-containing protein, partial [Streptomyces sp. NPDC005877]